MLKIFDNYYLDASGVCYMLKKAHVKGDGKGGLPVLLRKRFLWQVGHSFR